MISWEPLLEFASDDVVRSYEYVARKSFVI